MTESATSASRDATLASSYGACEGHLQNLPDAMDARTYHDILLQKDLHKDKVAKSYRPASLPVEDAIFGDAHEESYSERCLREDLARNKVCWYGVFTKDLWEYSRNSNPLIALWASHPLHPISRRERYIITFAQVLFVMMISTSIPRAIHCFRAGFKDCGMGPLDLLDPEDGVWANRDFCCLSKRIGMQCFIRHFGTKWGGSVYALVANILFGQLLYQAGANCCCVQKYHRLRFRCESIGHLIIILICFLILIPIPKFVMYCIDKQQIGLVIYTFITGKIGSMLGTTIFQTIVWYGIWRKQCPQNADGRLCGVNLAPAKVDDRDCDESGFHVTSLDYWSLARTLNP